MFVNVYVGMCVWFMCVYFCGYVHACVCVYVSVYMHVFAYMDMYVQMCICMWVNACICTCECMCVCTHVYVCICTYVVCVRKVCWLMGFVPLSIWAFFLHSASFLGQKLVLSCPGLCGSLPAPWGSSQEVSKLSPSSASEISPGTGAQGPAQWLLLVLGLSFFAVGMEASGGLTASCMDWEPTLSFWVPDSTPASGLSGSPNSWALSFSQGPCLALFGLGG